MTIDLDAYFARIGYAGPRRPELATLAAIQRLHPQAIAFENLDPLLQQPVRLDPGSLARKLIHAGRGGYCFEHNFLLMHVLRALGFHARGLGARVLWGAPEGAVTARSHMLLRVALEGVDYIADVGFGGMTLTAPLRLELEDAQPTPHEPFRLMRAGEYRTMQACIGDAWTTLYRFDLQEQFLPDYEMANWFCCTSPSSHFTSSLIAARTGPGVRHALHNAELSEHRVGGASERRALRSAAELRDALTDIFGLRPPDAAGLDAMLERFVTKAA